MLFCIDFNYLCCLCSNEGIVVLVLLSLEFPETMTSPPTKRKLKTPLSKAELEHHANV